MKTPLKTPLKASLTICRNCGTQYALPVGTAFKCQCGHIIVGGQKTLGYWLDWILFGCASLLCLSALGAAISWIIRSGGAG